MFLSGIIFLLILEPETRNTIELFGVLALFAFLFNLLVRLLSDSD